MDRLIIFVFILDCSSGECCNQRNSSSASALDELEGRFAAWVAHALANTTFNSSTSIRAN